MGLFAQRLYRDHKNAVPLNMTVLHPDAIGTEIAALGSTYGSAAWPAANRAIIVPFTVVAPILVTKLYYLTGASCSTTNWDMGIYDSSFAKIVSAGSTGFQGNASISSKDITDTWLAAGRYYWALAKDNTADADVARFAPGSDDVCKMIGVHLMDAAFPLPATLSVAAALDNLVPFMGMTIFPNTTMST